MSGVLAPAAANPAPVANGLVSDKIARV